MSDINIRIGGDNSDYRRVLQESEVSSAEFNKRVAAQSAAVLNAESRLSEVRGRNDTLRASGYNQDIFLQREILALKAEIAAMEAGSLAQTEKKIVLEGKLLQLEQSISAQKANQGRYYSSTAKDVGDLARAAGAAQERAGGLGSAMGRLVSVAGVLKGAFTSLIGVGSALFAPAIADQLARWVTGFSKAEQEMLEKSVETTAKAAAAQEAAYKKAQEAHEESLRERGKRELAQMELVSDARQEAIKLAVEEEKKARQSVYDQQVKADEEHMAEVKENFELLALTARATRGLTSDESDRLAVLKLIVKQKAIEAEITTLLSLKKRSPEEEARLQTLIRQNNVIQDQIANVGKVKDAVKAIEPVIESNISAWRKFQQAITSTGRGDSALSDRELERKIRNIQQDIFQRQTVSPGQPDFFLDPQKNNLRQTQAELDLRNRVRRDVAAFGEDRAFGMNSGLTEQRFREILQGIDTSATGKLATAIDKLNQRLDGPLLATLKPSPFGS